MTMSKPERRNGASDQRASDPVADTGNYMLILGNNPSGHRVAAEVESAIPGAHGIWVAGDGVGRRVQDEAGAASNAASDRKPCRCTGDPL
jgi:hypothetical protein